MDPNDHTIKDKPMGFPEIMHLNKMTRFLIVQFDIFC